MLVTAVYAVLTWLIARRTGDAAKAAQVSAEASRKAAESAARATAVAEASLHVEFEAKIRPMRNGEVWLNVKAKSASVYVHSVVAKLTVVRDLDPLNMEKAAVVSLVPAAATGSVSNWDFPKFLHVGEEVSLSWPRPIVRPGDDAVYGFLDFDYSLTVGGEHRVRSIYVESRDGLWKHLLSLIEADFLTPTAKSGDNASVP